MAATPRCAILDQTPASPKAAGAGGGIYVSDTSMNGVRIAGLGRYVPERVVTNDDLARMVGTSDQWIRERTGIRERRLAADHETASSMGVLAAREALAMAGIEGPDLDLIIVATTTGDSLFPPASC